MKRPSCNRYLRIVLLLLILAFQDSFAQAQKFLTAVIEDQDHGNPVPFASVRFKRSGLERIADSAGTFTAYLPFRGKDTLEITSVGYQDLLFPIDPGAATGDTLRLLIRIVPGKMETGVVVRQKVNRGRLLWRRIVAHKDQNDRRQFRNYSYELYNKLEFDLKNVNTGKMTKARLLKPFQFVWDNVDTAGGTPFLPAYLTEAVSDYYYQQSPLKRREVFKGIKTVGLQNQSVSRLLGGMDGNINMYKNYIPVFSQSFISPISDQGEDYYRYKIADTQYIQGKRIIHFLFYPLRKGENTFEGEGWVHDTTYAVVKMQLQLGKNANINFLEKLSMVQEYSLINDSTWFLSRDQFVLDLNLVGKRAPSVICRKTTTYRQVKVNDAGVAAALAENTVSEEVVMPPKATEQPDTFWVSARHEALNKNEQSIYRTMDTLLKMPVFKKYTKIAELIGMGCLDIGNYEIGPFYNWVSSSSVEGIRVRFDLSTNTDFSKKVHFTGYLAYGLQDREWKGRIKGKYVFKRTPRMHVLGYYSHDFDYGQEYLGEFISDNVFALAFRRPGIPVKFMKLKEQRLEWFREWKDGFSVTLSERHKAYTPVKNLPGAVNFPSPKGNPLTSFELSAGLRFAYLEKFIENTFSRVSLGSPYPIAEIRYTKGISGVGNSSYDFQKLSGSLHFTSKVPPIGTISLGAFGGKTYGTLPYMFLDVAPGNEMYYYNKFSFNLMNRYEFVHDRYAGVSAEHNIGSGLFRYIPLIRKMKWRQFWTAKGLWGDISEQNRTLNFSTQHFKSLDGKPYLELGTGVDNIFKVLRVDCIWRVLPSTGSPSNGRFGVFGSIRVGL